MSGTSSSAEYNGQNKRSYRCVTFTWIFLLHLHLFLPLLLPFFTYNFRYFISKVPLPIISIFSFFLLLFLLFPLLLFLLFFLFLLFLLITSIYSYFSFLLHFDFLGIPQGNSESFQILKYDIGQAYAPHHDFGGGWVCFL